MATKAQQQDPAARMEAIDRALRKNAEQRDALREEAKVLTRERDGLTAVVRYASTLEAIPEEQRAQVLTAAGWDASPKQ